MDNFYVIQTPNWKEECHELMITYHKSSVTFGNSKNSIHTP